VHKLKLAAIQ